MFSSAAIFALLCQGEMRGHFFLRPFQARVHVGLLQGTSAPSALLVQSRPLGWLEEAWFKLVAGGPDEHQAGMLDWQ